MTEPAVAAAVTYAALDAAYRAATARTSLAVAQALSLRWTSVDPKNIARTSGPWLADAIEIVLAGQRQTVQYANLYTDGVRRLAAPNAQPWTPPPPKPPNVEQVRKSLVYTGLRTTASEISRVDAVERAESSANREVPASESAGTADARRQQLMDEAFARIAATAGRFVTLAGHDQIYDNIQSDPVATGWYRVTKAGCCHFCAMLASRGAVFKEDSFALSDPRFFGPGNQKVHDTCGCGLRPAYGNGDETPDRDRVEALDAMWGESQKQIRRGESAINAFRRMYSASPLAAPTVE